MTPSPARKRGRPPKDADTSLRRVLIQQSAKLFREQGFERTTVRDIAHAAGVQAGSWFYHFKSKHEILAAVMREGMADSLARIQQLDVATLPAKAALRALIHTHLHTILAPDHDFIPVMLYEWRSLPPAAQVEIAALQQQYEAVWESVIARLQQHGDWPMPTRADRLFLFGSLNWIAQWYRPDGPLSLDDLVDDAMVFFLRSA
ncbi:AcrR family transcriptional regulator [Chitinivorax tropicus]|uniref:AcrR family transcriptional regulator n=1 Tax=Chitinivorax tropicus TaxID=714531 RepID=A0A840MEW3_9PROT|nr:TetR/AcrR family transcriptional regulator [Chitinivorax tropicus]MBB5016930.1 AcrR family transcriptional regulator [Chitinivorax tropicus]